MNYVVVVPCYRPPASFIKLIKELTITNVSKIIVVDDGNNEAIDTNIFESNKVVVLRHKVNYGKGAAIKTALSYVQKMNNKNLGGIVFIDCDGQHSIEDMQKLIQYHRKSPDGFVIGTRNFSSQIVPLKSKFGNLVASGIFRLIFKKKVFDTQSGLRIIPPSLINDFLNVKNDRFAFELETLVIAVKKTYLIQIPISTIYLDKNKNTNFKPLFDSMSIFYTLFRAAFVGLTGLILDYVILLILLLSINNLFYSLLIARVVGLSYSAFLIRNFVWKSENLRYYSYIKYLILWSLNLLFIYFILDRYASTIREIIFLKLLIDFVLFLINFSVQKKIFKSTKTNKIK